MASSMGILTRDGNRCLHCGTSDRLSIQHRVNRGMGGSKDPRIHAPSNLLTICWAFNVQMESQPDMAELGRKYGWKLTRDQDPLTVPVWDAQAQLWYRLDDEYNRTPTYGTA